MNIMLMKGIFAVLKLADEGAEKSKKREAAEAEAEQENDMRLCRAEFAGAGA